MPAEGQRTGPVTYATILPDEMPGRESDNGYIMRNKRSEPQRREQLQRRGGDDRQREPLAADRDAATGFERGSNSDETDQRPGDNRSGGDKGCMSAVKAGIHDNKMLAYGLLVVVAVLLIIIAWQVMQQKKLADEAKAQAGNQPPGGPQLDPQQQPPASDQPQGPPDDEQPRNDGHQRQPRAVAEGKQAARNDKILGQQQQRRVLASNGTRARSAMAQARNGRRKADDRQRMEAVMEEADEGVDEVGSNMRAMIQRSLQEEAVGEDGQYLGEGSPEVVDADAVARKELRREQMDQMGGNPSGEARDEALAQLEDFEQEEEEDQVVALCDYILPAGARSGQECQADCKPGKTRCARHLKAK